MKVCRVCGLPLPEADFYKRPRYRDGLDTACKKCIAAQTLRYYTKNKEKVRETKRRYIANNRDQERARQRNWRNRRRDHVRERKTAYCLRTKYGISVSDFDAMMTKQASRCAVCDLLFTAGRKPHVDHDHKRNTVRGLLCGSCNRALGLFGDSRFNLARAVKYLERNTPT